MTVCAWIPAFAGMTGLVQRDAAVVWAVCNAGLMNQAPTRLCYVRVTYRGVQRGEAPLRSSSSPKIGDEGVESGIAQEGWWSLSS